MSKNYIVTPLLIITVCIWAFIFYEIFNYLTNQDEEENDENIILSNIDTLNYTVDGDIEYSYLNRDPFTLIKSIQEKIPVINMTNSNNYIEQPKQKLNYKLLGLIIRNQKQTVILEDIVENNIVYLTEGSVYKSIKIIKINPKTIVISEHNESFLININL